MSFSGFSEEDIQRLKTQRNSHLDAPSTPPTNVKKAQIGVKTRRHTPQYKLRDLSDEHMDSIDISFDKCKLSLKTPTDDEIKQVTAQIFQDKIVEDDSTNKVGDGENKTNACETIEISNSDSVVNMKPDVVSSSNTNYAEATETAHSAKLELLQIKQRLMEEQNRKRKEMLAKALADRTKQTEEEVLKLEKIKKELQVLDGQFSQDVAVLRKKIDQASLTYADAEKQYLRVEKEFLQAKMNLQKEKEKKELLSEHLCALITHNETRKAQKLVTLMQQLASSGDPHSGNTADKITEDKNGNIELDNPVVVDGVDERTGKMVEVNDFS